MNSLASSSASSQRFLPLSTPIVNFNSNSKTQTLLSVPCFSKSRPYLPPITKQQQQQQKKRRLLVSVATEDLTDVIPVHCNDSVDQQQQDASGARAEEEANGGVTTTTTTINQVSGLAFESGGGGGGSIGGGGGGIFPSSSNSSSPLGGEEDLDKMVDRSINAAIVLAASTFAITKLLTIDRDYWHVGN